MAEVVVELGNKEILRIPLKGPSMSIGRDPQCDLHLDNRALSRRHAQIEKRGAAIWVRDLNSQNGTYVNGDRINEPRALNGGDIVEVGRYLVRIEGAEEARGDYLWFVDADVVVLTDIYASGTAPIPGVTGKLVVNAVIDAHPRSRVVWMPKRDDLVEFLARELRDGDVCISMGCGDVAALPDEVQARRGELRAAR